MPELPEVENVARGLRRLEGERLRKLEVLDEKVWFESELEPGAFPGRKLERVARRGKYILLRFEEGATLVQHLRMTGKMLEATSSALPSLLRAPVSPQAGRKRLQLRCQFQFERSCVVFFDTRRFGTLTAIKDEAAFFARKGIAPDPLDQEIEALAVFLAGMERSERPVKTALLDQTLAAGAGNIYADEALFRAGVDPRTPARRVKDPVGLWRGLLGILRASVEKGGTTIIDYVNAAGETGTFSSELAVYGRTGEACSRCGKIIRRITLGGRSTHFCPACQKRR